MQIKMWILVAFLIVASLAPAIAQSIIPWPSNVCPPVRLEEAIELALAEVGDDSKKRYCIEATLFADSPGQPIGTWHLLFASDDGSVKSAAVNMSKECTIQLWEEPSLVSSVVINPDVEAISNQLNSTFGEEFPGMTTSVVNGTLVVKNKVRSYSYYPTLPNGDFASELLVESGPQPDGFLIEAKIANSEDLEDHNEIRTTSPYWNEYRYVFRTSDSRKVLKLQAKWGIGRSSGRLRDELLSAFGTRDFKE